MKKIICLIGMGIMATGIFAQEIPVMKEEISNRIYIPSLQEQQNLSDAEYNAYRQAGLITKPRSVSNSKEKTVKKRGSNQKRTVTQSEKNKPTVSVEKTTPAKQTK